MAENFKILSDREWIITRPGMFIGSTSVEPISSMFNGKWKTLNVVPGLIKIIEEVYQNSVDEFIRTNGKHANEIGVSILEEGLDGWQVTITDNGRGIPSVKHDGLYQAELCWTRAKAGSNFSDDDRVTIGMNGVGSFATNCFSTSFSGQSCDGKELVQVDCKDNCQTISTSSRKNKVAGTKVAFHPDLAKFGLVDIDEEHIEYIRDRLNNLAICFPGLKFTFNTNKGTEKIFFKNKATVGDVYKDSLVFEPTEEFLLLVAPSGDQEEFRHVSYVNGISVKNGGSHVDGILDLIIEQMRPMIKRKWKIEILPNQIKQHILLGTWIRGFSNPKFDSQTKERITNSKSEINAFLSGFPAEAIAKKIMATEAIIDPIVQATLYKKELADRLALARTQKKAAKKNIANHIVAQDPNPENRSLMICEGLSAIGPLIAVRDADKVGGYSLRGKVLNTRNMKPVEVVQNKELSELMAVVGLEFGKPALDLNYGKICIMTDQDVDGSSIFCLLLNFLSNWPELFEQGRVFRCLTPLYVCKKGNQEKWFYDQAEYEASNVDDSWNVRYMKGLGSLSKDIYKSAINQPKLLKVDYKEIKDFDPLEMAFGDDTNKRKEWLLND